MGLAVGRNVKCEIIQLNQCLVEESLSVTGHETGSQPSIDRPMIYRAYRMPRLEIRPSGTTPGYFSSARKGGGVEQNRTRTRAVPEILHWRTRPNFLAKFFGKKFWK